MSRLLSSRVPTSAMALARPRGRFGKWRTLTAGRDTDNELRCSTMASRVTRVTGERAIEKLMQCRGYCFTVVELQAVEHAAFNKRVEIGIANLDIDAEEPA